MNQKEEDDEMYLWNDNIAYLLLDDVVKQGTNIDIIEDTGEATTLAGHRKNSRLSIGSECSKASRSSAILMNSILHDSQSLSFNDENNSRNHASALKISSSLINDEGAVLFSSFGNLKHGNGNKQLVSTGPLRSDQGISGLNSNGDLHEISAGGGGFQAEFEGGDWGGDDDGDDGGYGPDYGDGYGEGRESIVGPHQTPLKSLPIVPSQPILASAAAAAWGSLPQASLALPLPLLPSASPATVAPTAPKNNPLALFDPHDPTEATHSKPVKKDKRTYRIPMTKQNQLKVNTGASGLTRRQVMLNSLNHKQQQSGKGSQLMSSADLISMITRCSITSHASSVATSANASAAPGASASASTSAASSSFGTVPHLSLSLSGNPIPLSRSLAMIQQKKRSSSSSHGTSSVSNPLLRLEEGFICAPSGSGSGGLPLKKERQEERDEEEIDFYGGGGGGDDYGYADDDNDDAGGGFDNYGDPDPDNLNNELHGNSHHREEKDGDDQHLNEALSHLNEERLLAQRVDHVLNDALGLGDVSLISSDLYSRHSLGEEDGTTSFTSFSSHPNHPHPPQSFEKLCKKFIQNFIIGTEKYSRETNLMKRVNEWTNKIEPLLKEQEERGVFDIHEYSDQTLETIHQKIQEHQAEGAMEENDEEQEQEMKKRNKDKKKDKEKKEKEKEKKRGEVVHFSEIVEGKPAYEVSRVFLACLQLANLGNVDFQQSNGEHDDFDVNLLSEKSNRLQIENYRAPSVMS
jgi:hypothetical protein